MLVGRRISLRRVASLVAMASCIVIYPAAAEDRAPYEPQLLGFEIEVEGVAVWRGAPAVIELYPSLSSHGSVPGGVARISFDGVDERGQPLGVYFEVTPETLRSTRWSIALRGVAIIASTALLLLLLVRFGGVDDREDRFVHSGAFHFSGLFHLLFPIGLRPANSPLAQSPWANCPRERRRGRGFP